MINMWKNLKDRVENFAIQLGIAEMEVFFN